ncbi:hypothetical protein KY289_004327 [Solanum tuberosum]|nr:hypothetical protein KY289_004327 [Solanum tuberosum]
MDFKHSMPNATQVFEEKSHNCCSKVYVIALECECGVSIKELHSNDGKVRISEFIVSPNFASFLVSHTFLNLPFDPGIPDTPLLYGAKKTIVPSSRFLSTYILIVALWSEEVVGLGLNHMWIKQRNSLFEDIGSNSVDIIELEKARQWNGHKLIPSENFTSLSMMLVLRVLHNSWVVKFMFSLCWTRASLPEDFDNEQHLFVDDPMWVDVVKIILDHMLFFGVIAQFGLATIGGDCSTKTILDLNLEDESIVMNQSKPWVDTYRDVTQATIGLRNKIKRPSQRLIWDPSPINN